MAAVTAAVVAAGATAYAANRQSKAAKDAAGASRDAANAGIGEQRSARDEYQRNIAPYLTQGTNALYQIAELNSGNTSSFQESPDYQFARDYGLQGLDRSATARGAVNSGGADADRIAFASGLASQQYGNYYNRLYNLAAMGQNAAAQQGTASQNTANSIGGLLANGAAAQGNAAIGQANAWSNAAAGLSGLAGQFAGQQQYNPNSYQNNPNYLSPIQRETFTPDTTIRPFGG